MTGKGLNPAPEQKEKRTDTASRPTLIPVGSGKGGVGKSFLTANLAVALAERGHSVAAVDADLGGSNLYAFLGLQNRYPGIGDFLKARSGELADLLVPTEIPRLHYLAGDGRSPFMANIPHAQKVRLITHLKRLPVDYVLLDLSAGSSFHTLDLFRSFPPGLVVTVPEFPAIINLLTFLKHTVTRNIEKMFAADPSVRALLAAAYKKPLSGQLARVESLKSAIAEIEPSAGEKIDILCRRFRPRIVFNKGDHPEDLGIAAKIDAGLMEVLSIEGDYFGFLFRDRNVRQSVNHRQIHLSRYPQGATADAIRQIAVRIEKFWRKPIDQSAKRIAEHAGEIYRAMERQFPD